MDRLPGQLLSAAGTLVGSLNDVGGVTIPGALNSAGTFTIANHVTFNGGGTVNFDLGATTTAGGSVNDLVAVNGNLTFGGVTTLAVNNLNGSIASGVYRLFSCGGTLAGGVANLQLAAPTPTRQTMTLSTAIPGQVNLNVTGSAANLTWRGDSFFNFWDVNVGFNWDGTPEGTFLNLDHVSFLDPVGTPNTLVTIPAAVFPASVTVNSAVDYTFAGAGRISGGTGITKSGAGKLIVNTNNDNFGTTTINAGILQVGSGNNTGNLGTGNIVNDATLVFNRSTSLTVPGVISGSGTLEKAGTGTLILLGNNTYTGMTTISAGTLQIGNGTEAGAIGPGEVINNGVLIVSHRDSLVFSNMISGTGRVEKAGTNDGGLVEFTALNTYTGSTTINGLRTVLVVDKLANGGVPSNIGASASDAPNLHIRTEATLRYVGPGATTDRLFTIGTAKIEASGTGPLVFSNTGAIGTSGGGRTLTLLGTNAQGNTLAAAIVDDANGVTNLVKNGDGIWVVSGNSSYTGVTTVNAGTLRVGSGNALGSTFNGTSVVGDVAGKGRLELAGGITLAGETLFMGGRQGSSAPVPHLNNVSGNNHWTGPIRLTAGGLEYTLQSDSGTLTIGGDITQTLTTLERFLNLQGAGNGVINGVISNGTGSQIQTLRKRGSGTWTLNGANTYAGSTIVDEGTLVSNSGVTSSVATTVGTGASTATLSTRHIRQASLTIAAGSRVNTLAGGATSVLGTLSMAGTPDAPTAKLDLTNSALVIDYPPAGPNPAADTRQQIIAGRGGTGLGKPWNGKGISSSTAQADVAASPNSRSIGYAVNADLPLGALTTFRGQAVDPSSVLIRYTRTADANLDGVVNDDDVTVVGTFYAPGVSKPEWAKGDFDFNGFVDDDDVTLLGVFYNPSATSIPAPAAGDAAAAVAAVPEPATVVLFGVMAIAIGAVAMTRKR